MVSDPSSSAGASSRPGISRDQWMTLAAAFLGWMFDGFEQGLFPLVGRPALADLVHANGSDVDVWFSLMIAGFLVGAATGGVLFGWLGDRLGRVRAMTLSVLTYAIFMGLCGIASSPGEVFAYRFVSSLGMGGEWSLGVALVMEIWPDHSRALLAGLIGAASNVGFLLIALIGLGLGRFISSVEHALLQIGLGHDLVARLVSNSGWRLMMFAGALPALLTFFIRLFVPESERWRHEKQLGATVHWATRDLLAVLVGCCGPLAMIYLWSPQSTISLGIRIGGSLVGLLLAVAGFVFPVFRYLGRARAASGSKGISASVTLRRMLLGACLSGVALLGTWASAQFAPTWAGKLVERSAERQGISPASDSVKADCASARSLSQILAGLGAIVGTMGGALLGNAIGRRPTYTLLCIGSLAMSLLFYLTNSAFGSLFLVEIFFMGGVTASFYGWFPLYLPELFPTRVRATGQGFSYNFGRILAAVGALQTGNLMGLFESDRLGAWASDQVLSHAIACASMSLIYLVGAAIIWLAPETRGQPLPE